MQQLSEFKNSYFLMKSLQSILHIIISSQPLRKLLKSKMATSTGFKTNSSVFSNERESNRKTNQSKLFNLGKMTHMC